MAQIREAIEAICTVLNNHCPDQVSAESFRLAKFDKNETTAKLWRTLYTVLCIQHFQPIDESIQDLVHLCKHKMFQKGYRTRSFYFLPEDMSHGSRELMLALGWLMAKEDVLTMFINGLEPLILEDPPIDMALYEKIPLTATVDHQKTPKQKDLQNPVHVAERLTLNYNKLNLTLRSLLASRNEYTKIICKLHSVPKRAKSHTSSHFSSQDVYHLCYPQEMLKCQERLQWFCNYGKAILFWAVNEVTFWKWMTSVLDAKIHNGIKSDSEMENANNCPHNQFFKPSRILQRAKENQIDISQVLNTQETLYRTISKCWKKLRAILQETCRESNNNLLEHLRLLDSELLVEIKELQKDFKSCDGHFKHLTSPKNSQCLKKLGQGQPKTGKASKEVNYTSAASEEITRLLKEKQALEIKLRNLQEKQRAEVHQISKNHPNIVCISTNFKGSSF